MKLQHITFTGVRTDDWFDIDKVRRVLEICEPIINKYK